MPEGPEIETERLHEAIKEEMEHGGGSFLRNIALSTTVLAAVAAVAALHAGATVNEALALKTDATRLQAQASDQWGFYQAKGLKSAGVPSVKDGEAIAAAFADSVEVLRAAYAKATTDAAALPTTDAVAFATAARVLAAQLQATGTALSDTLTTTAQTYPASDVVKAFRATKACRTFA